MSMLGRKQGKEGGIHISDFRHRISGATDRVVMLEHSIYSVISPEGCSAESVG